MSNIQTIVKEFNEEALNFAIQMGQLLPNYPIAKNLDLVKSVMKLRPKFIIEQFVLHVLKYKDQIDSNDENFFLENKFSDETNGDADIISKVFEFKDVWKSLSSKNKQGIFQVMQILCYYAQEYFIKKYNN